MKRIEKSLVRLKPEIKNYLKVLAAQKETTISDLIEKAAIKTYKIPVNAKPL